MMMFHDLFMYMYFDKADIRPGHTAEIGGTQLRFSDLTEHHDLFGGKKGTLVITMA